MLVAKKKIWNVFLIFQTQIKLCSIIAHRKSTNISNTSVKYSHDFFHKNYKTQNPSLIGSIVLDIAPSARCIAELLQ